ncbi:MAG: methyl-accepting chemotaxis protein [Planctomycetota bacterium]
MSDTGNSTQGARNSTRTPLSRSTDSIGTRTFAGSVIAVLATGVAIGFAGIMLSERAVIAEREASFEATLAARAESLQDYLATLESQVETLSADPSTARALADFTGGFDAESGLVSDGGAASLDALSAHHDAHLAERFRKAGATWRGGAAIVPADAAARRLQERYIARNPHPLGSKHQLDASEDGRPYDLAHAAHHPQFRRVLEAFGFYDVFLIDANGRIVYSVYKETDFATSLKDGPFAESNLAKLARRALESKTPDAIACDFQSYLPSYGAPAGFIAAPILRDGAAIGAVAVQVPIDRIDRMCGIAAGLGETGEVALVGADGEYRSNLRLAGAPTVRTASAYSALAARAVAGEAGFVRANFEGREQIAAFRPFDFLGTTWSIVGAIDVDEVLAPMQALNWWIAGISIGSVTLVCIVAIPLARSTTRRARAVVVGLDHLARGELDHRLEVEGHDEFAAISMRFNDFASTMSRSLAEVRGGAEKLNSESALLSRSSESLASVASEQAASIEEMSAAVTELREQTARTAEESRGAQMTTTRGAEDAERAKTAVGGLEQSMGEIDRAAREIGQIVRVIDEIAFQTNLLALNAAVEAARAGEAGRGFAVVAQEVRALATRSGEAARKTTALVDSASSRVGRGVEFSHSVREALEKILVSSGEVARSVDAIAQAQAEHLSGITQLDQGIAEISRTTQEAAAQSQQVASSARESTQEVESLRANVARFRIAA